MRPRCRAAGWIPLLLTLLPVALGGCSQLSNTSSASNITTSSIATESHTPPYRETVPVTQPAYSWNGNPVRAEATPPAQQVPHQVWRVSPRPPDSPYPAAAAPGSPRTVEVMHGDTLYGISRRHGVAVASLVDANRLNGISIYPGQRLVLPAGAR